MTKIEWTKNTDGSKGKSWNPIRAFRADSPGFGWYCQKCSPGCVNCYAERINLWQGNGVHYAADQFDKVSVCLSEETLLSPLRWKKPTTIFVCSQTDLFGEWVPEEWIGNIYAIEALCPQHTFIHVTKRPKRRLDFLSVDGYPHPGSRRVIQIRTATAPYLSFCLDKTSAYSFPLRNVREMVTVCNQDEADRLIPILLETPATCRGVSIEPILGPIDLRKWLRGECPQCHGFDDYCADVALCETCRGLNPIGLDWVIVGGESGSSARPCNIEWLRSIVAQCKASGVPCFVKQLGAVPMESEANWRGRAMTRLLSARNAHRVPDDMVPLLYRAPAGRDPAEWPEDLRVREYPEQAK